MRNLTLTLLAALALSGAGVAAPPDAALATATAPRPIPALQLAKVTVREAAARLTKESGVLVVPDSTLANSRVSLQTIGGSLDIVLAQLLAQLPKGSQLKQSHLPSAAATAPNPNGDVVGMIIEINDALAAPLNGGKKPAPGALILQGRVVPEDKAEATLLALDLKPVYLLTNPRGRDAANQFSSMQGDILRLWQTMTPEQRKSAVDKQWDDFVNMDPATRKTYMQQMMEQSAGVMQKIQQLPSDQLKSLFGGLMPPGGGGGKP